MQVFAPPLTFQPAPLGLTALGAPPAAPPAGPDGAPPPRPGTGLLPRLVVSSELNLLLGLDATPLGDSDDAEDSDAAASSTRPRKDPRAGLRDAPSARPADPSARRFWVAPASGPDGSLDLLESRLRQVQLGLTESAVLFSLRERDLRSGEVLRALHALAAGLRARIGRAAVRGAVLPPTVPTPRQLYARAVLQARHLPAAFLVPAALPGRACAPQSVPQEPPGRQAEQARRFLRGFEAAAAARLPQWADGCFASLQNLGDGYVRFASPSDLLRTLPAARLPGHGPLTWHQLHYPCAAGGSPIVRAFVGAEPTMLVRGPQDMLFTCVEGQPWTPTPFHTDDGLEEAKRAMWVRLGRAIHQRLVTQAGQARWRGD